MGNIIFIQENGLYMKGIVSILNDEIPEHTFHLYSYSEVLSGEKEINYSADLLIFELTPNTNLDKIYEKYKNSNFKMAIWTFTEVYKKQILEFMKIGMNGYFYGDMELSQIKLAINEILDGHSFIHPRFSSLILNEYSRITNKKVSRPLDLLTKREWDILERMSNGYQNEEIANQLFISDKTVKNHVSSILKKLKVKDRTNAVVTAIKNNWVSE
ncbi:response regulator transcription factor [Oceanobacillus sp. FSL H7-0719]|uniref:response regulator transcription factor n=1 Tax=Oceanobacillus sp. FSL H7-0719 TaxID=2954507 RepID=UPI00324CB031